MRIPRKERERKENLDVRGTGIFVECVSRITGSYQYALIPRYMKKLERIRIGYTVTLFTRRESRIGDRYEIKKEKRILIKEVSRLFCKLFFFYSGYDKFEILVDEIRYVSFEIKKKKKREPKEYRDFFFYSDCDKFEILPISNSMQILRHLGETSDRRGSIIKSSRS